MKFSDIQAKDWEQWKPYLDTCLMPLTGLAGDEQPWEATEKLEALRDVLDCLEKPFHGRVVTYPALHYVPEANGAEALGDLCKRLKAGGFTNVVLVATKPEYGTWNIEEADLTVAIDPAELRENLESIRQQIHQSVQALWQKTAEGL